MLKIKRNEGKSETKFIALVDLMDKKAWRKEDSFEGGWHTEYFIRNTHL